MTALNLHGIPTPHQAEILLIMIDEKMGYYEKLLAMQKVYPALIGNELAEQLYKNKRLLTAKYSQFFINKKNQK